MTPLLLGAATAGLFGSAHCVGMCGPFAAACSTTKSEAVAWHSGRLSTYAVLGGLAGATGAYLPGPPWVVSGVAVVLLVWFAARLAGLSAPSHWVPEFLVRASQRVMGWQGAPGRYVFGMLTGLLPCGLVYAALGVPMAAADPAVGALSMVVFGLGTVPALAVLSSTLTAVSQRTPWVRRTVALGVLAAGLWSVNVRHHALDHGSDEPPTCHEADPAG